MKLLAGRPILPNRGSAPEEIGSSSLEAQLASKLKRPLTEQELAVLRAPVRPALLSDRHEMPAVAQQLLDVWRTRLRWLSGGADHAFSVGSDWQPRFPSRPALLVIALAGAPLFPLVVVRTLTQLFSGAAAIEFLLPDVLLLALWVGPYVALVKLRRGQLELQTRLRRSDLIEQLLAGDLPVEDIYDHTPLPWRWFILGGRKTGLRDRALYVANYLDWYLRPPRTHWRWYWLQYPVAAALGLAAIDAWRSGIIAAPGGLFPPIATGVSSVILSTVVLATLVVNQQRLMFTSCLVAELRRRFVTPTDERAN